MKYNIHSGVKKTKGLRGFIIAFMLIFAITWLVFNIIGTAPPETDYPGPVNAPVQTIDIDLTEAETARLAEGRGGLIYPPQTDLEAINE